MDLQSTTALEILLLIAHGLCAYLKDRIDRSCAHGIPSVTGDAERDLNFLEKVGKGRREYSKASTRHTRKLERENLQGIRVEFEFPDNSTD